MWVAFWLERVASVPSGVFLSSASAAMPMAFPDGDPMWNPDADFEDECCDPGFVLPAPAGQKWHTTCRCEPWETCGICLPMHEDDELVVVEESDDDDDDVFKSAAGAAAPPQQAGGKPPVHPLPVETPEEKQRGAKRPLEPLSVCWCQRPRKFYRHLCFLLFVLTRGQYRPWCPLLSGSIRMCG